MRRIISLAALSLTLFGGVAMAGNRYDGRAEHHVVEQREARRAPEARDRRELNERRVHERGEERRDERRGFRWEAGVWQWSGYQRVWIPGHYVRS
jgi:hypothetical protein